MLNGVGAIFLGLITLLGSETVFTPSGYGPDRIAIAALFGPLAGQSGWILFGLGVMLGMVGYGLFTLRSWARLVLLTVLIVDTVLTVAIIVSGLYRDQWAVIIASVLKLALYCTLCLYLTRPAIRDAFSRRAAYR